MPHILLILVAFLLPFLAPTPGPMDEPPSDTSAEAPAKASVQLVSFTAQWCPNCKVLDPKMDAALATFTDGSIGHIVLDMTDETTRQNAFLSVNGTVYAEVYGDHLGWTGIGIITAADTGEKLGCVQRNRSVEDIVVALKAAKESVSTRPPYMRKIDGAPCPPANTKVAL